MTATTTAPYVAAAAEINGSARTRYGSILATALIQHDYAEARNAVGVLEEIHTTVERIEAKIAALPARDRTDMRRLFGYAEFQRSLEDLAEMEELVDYAARS